MEKLKVQRSPILSLTILDGSSLLEDGAIDASCRVLVVARRAETNSTHPNVVSVPTQRLPTALYSAIVESADPTGDVAESSYFRGGMIENMEINGHHPVVYAVESLLARKLGLADHLECDHFRFRAALRTRIAVVALYDNLGPESVYEPVNMLNVVVEMQSQSSLLPLETSSYSMVAWTTVQAFLEGVETKDPTHINRKLDPLEFCVHGVCLQASQASLEHLLDRQPFPEHPAADSDPLMTAPRPLMPVENPPRD